MLPWSVHGPFSLVAAGISMQVFLHLYSSPDVYLHSKMIINCTVNFEVPSWNIFIIRARFLFAATTPYIADVNIFSIMYISGHWLN